MSINDFRQLYANNPTLNKLCLLLTDNKHKRIALQGLTASAQSMTIAEIFLRRKSDILVVADDADSAGYIYFDLVQLLGNEQLAYFPALYKHIHKSGATIAENEILRTDSLNKISNPKPCITVSYPEALSEKVVCKESFSTTKIELRRGEDYDMSLLIDRLQVAGFREVDFVYEVGQYSQRGSIIDVFSYSNELPYRIDFFGDNIESIRTFDIERQLSVMNVEELTIISATDNSENQKVSLLEFISNDSLLIINDIDYFIKRIALVYSQALIKANEQRQTSDLHSWIVDEESLCEQLENFRTVELLRNHYKADVMRFATIHQPNFDKNFDLISQNINRYIADGYCIYIASDSKKQTDRIASIFDDRGDNITFEAVQGTLHEGFIDHDMKLCFFTDHQIFSRFHKFSLKSDTARRGKAAMLIKELNQLKPGDYVVHHDHGVGQFAGLLKTEINGKPQEVIKLI